MSKIAARLKQIEKKENELIPTVQRIDSPIQIMKHIDGDSLSQLQNDVLIETLEYVESLRNEIQFIKSEIAICKQRLQSTTNAKSLFLLNKQYRLLLDTLDSVMTKMPIALMATSRPLQSLIRYRDSIKEIQEIDDNEKEQPSSECFDFDVRAIYKPYED